MHFHTVSDINILDYDLQKVSQNHSVILAMIPFDDKCQNLPKISEIKKIKIVYLQKVGQGHGVQFSQLHHWMANAKIYKYHPQIYALAFIISEITFFKF